MYKKDLATAIGVAVLGVILAYFVCNLIVGNNSESSFSVKTVESSEDLELKDPDPEIFNYRALNPTVEVYVGDCTDGNCEIDSTEQTESSEGNSDSGVNQGNQ